MHHILVPTDFSESAQAALDYAVELCQVFKGRITLLHVSYVDKLDESLMGLDAVQYLTRALELPAAQQGYAPTFQVDDLKQIARQKLEGRVTAVQGKVAIEAAVAEGRPSEKIVEYARDHNVDLIVMGTQGRGPVAQFFLGSVADNVVRSAECPVLTIRRKPPTR